ncbi:antitoxin [Mycolicibacterium sp. XJ879]
MSKRLQVVLDAEEWESLKEIARRHHTTVSDWVRRTLRAASEREPAGDLGSKLQAIRTAARHEFETADIDQMLNEIARGREELPERHDDPR